MTIRPGDFDPALNYLGESQFAADPLFKGRLDDVIIRDTVLTQAQIAGLMTNTAPQFNSNTISRAAGAGTFSGTIVGSATDADAGDVITYVKVNGPAWLAVAANGALTGTPSATSGVHEFVVTATDSQGMATFAALNIQLGQSNLEGGAVQQLSTPALATNDVNAPVRASLAGAAELMAGDRESDILRADAFAVLEATQAVGRNRDEIVILLTTYRTAFARLNPSLTPDEIAPIDDFRFDEETLESSLTDAFATW
jgi:hypothetical protein